MFGSSITNKWRKKTNLENLETGLIFFFQKKSFLEREQRKKKLESSGNTSPKKISDISDPELKVTINEKQEKM